MPKVAPILAHILLILIKWPKIHWFQNPTPPPSPPPLRSLSWLGLSHALHICHSPDRWGQEEEIFLQNILWFHLETVMNALYVEPVLPLSYLLRTNSRQLRILNSNYRTEMQKNILISTNWFTKLTAFCNSAIEQDNPHCWPTYQHFYFLSTETSYIFGQYSHYHTPYNAQMFHIMGWCPLDVRKWITLILTIR